LTTSNFVKRPRSRLCLILAAAVLLGGVWTLSADPPAVMPAGGQTPGPLRARYGPPTRLARQIFYGRYREQWEYDGPPGRLVLEGGRGRETRLLPP
jgi:hypothetical protein